MTNQHYIRRPHAKATLLGFLALFIGSVILLWSWNTIAVDLLALPQIRFRHALAFELALFAIAAVFPITWRIFMANRPGPARE